MEALSDLKAILHSKRANIYYLETCRVMVKGGRVVYLTEHRDEKSYWNIPIANTTVILLGMSTSITQAAVRLLASAGVLIGFSGSGATPLIAASEVEWLSPQSEYRPTQYMQGWMGFCFEPEKRLEAAKGLQASRLDFMRAIWSRDKELQAQGFYLDDRDVQAALSLFSAKIDSSETVGELLLGEAHFTKALYKISATRTRQKDCGQKDCGQKEFVRQHEGPDEANRFLNHGNYLAYGLAATTLWVLGIPHGFAVMHGKTRRGALVFDVAAI